MRCYFIRHGQSTNNLLFDTTGSTEGRNDDPALTPLGIIQAEKAAEYLNHGYDDNVEKDEGLGITHVYSSLMIRAVNTGTIISKKLGLPLNAWEEIHEQGGIFLDDKETGKRIGRTGKRKGQILELFPNLIIPGELNEQGWWNRPHEDVADARKRAKNVLDELFRRHGGTDDRVLLVSHNAFYACFMSAVLNLSEPDKYWFVLNNTGITRVDFLDQYTYLVYQNRVSFLNRDQIT